MRQPVHRSMLLPPESPGPARSRPWRSRLVAGVVVTTLSLSVAAPGEAGFKALLAQLVTYVNILVDEWEKHSRILEDHLEQAAGVMQPFTDIHAGVKELVDTTPDLFHSTARLVESYKAGLTDPGCYSIPPNCGFQADFLPPELRDVVYTARYGIPAGAQYTIAELEQFVFGANGYDRGSLGNVLTTIGHPRAAEIVRSTATLDYQETQSRWTSRRLRSAAARGAELVRQYLVTGPRDANGCPTSPTPNLIDQAAAADCLSATSNIASPLAASNAHLSPTEAGMIQASSLMSLVEMSALELETFAHQQEAVLAAEEAEERARRERAAAATQRLSCFESNGTIVYDDVTCGNAVSGDAFLNTQQSYLADSF